MCFSPYSISFSPSSSRCLSVSLVTCSALAVLQAMEEENWRINVGTFKATSFTLPNIYPNKSIFALYVFYSSFQFGCTVQGFTQKEP
ncbi:hypothetical protein LWI29_002825 [Acer saccharum]|uniref:Uncharacterized protein n=1 Tax=Acer saccharum TaxID=4024 RepID=A0AA39RYC4_ACESA|nr:hypothetical protein LWI29_002825 [Acer saccharum]